MMMALQLFLVHKCRALAWIFFYTFDLACLHTRILRNDRKRDQLPKSPSEIIRPHAIGPRPYAYTGTITHNLLLIFCRNLATKVLPPCVFISTFPFAKPLGLLL